MKVQIISDIHTEMHEDMGASFAADIDVSDIDVLVLAGDVGTMSTITPILRRLAGRVSHIVYVPGNHEFYNTTFDRFYDHIRGIAQKLGNVYVLDGEATTIAGQRFIGGTMWYRRTAVVDANWRCLNDFTLIKDAARFEEINQRHVQFIADTANSDDIVVTHHLPHWNSVAPMYACSALNCFFICDMEDVIVKNRPKLWMHGHTHTSFDYVVGETRIVCNPFGYSFEINNKYDGHKVIDV